MRWIKISFQSNILLCHSIRFQELTFDLVNCQLKNIVRFEHLNFIDAFKSCLFCIISQAFMFNTGSVMLNATFLNVQKIVTGYCNLD